MLTDRDLLKVRKKLVEIGGTAYFYFKDNPNVLVIGRFIRAVDKEGRTVPWSRAFGGKLIVDVIMTYGIDKIKVVLNDGRSIEFSSLRDFIKWVR